jgi:integrase
MAKVMLEFLGTKMPYVAAFSVPRRDKVSALIQADLKAARRAWIDEARTPEEQAERAKADFLAYRDAAGRHADFHSLRHTFISNLATGGIHPKTAQSLARHSTITLTMDRYSHVLRGAESAALAVLPDLTSAATARRSAANSRRAV